jgi:hypothetical protein
MPDHHFLNMRDLPELYPASPSSPLSPWMPWVWRPECVMLAISAYALCVYYYLRRWRPRLQQQQRLLTSSASSQARADWIKPFSIAYFAIMSVLSLAMAWAIWTSDWAQVCRQRSLRHCLDVDYQNDSSRNVYGIFSGVTGFWYAFACLTKYVEFIDTVILMVKGYDLLFLHWWHHMTVPILMMVHLYDPTSTVMSGWFFNSVVHTFMYAYYAGQSAGISLNFCKPYITLTQIVQFVGTLSHCAYVIYHNGWRRHWLSMSFAFTIYASYLFLFYTMFRKSYGSKKGGKKPKPQQQPQQQEEQQQQLQVSKSPSTSSRSRKSIRTSSSSRSSSRNSSRSRSSSSK